MILKGDFTVILSYSNEFAPEMSSDMGSDDIERAFHCNIIIFQ